MAKFRITYALESGVARSKTIDAESEGEAIDQFDDFADQSSQFLEFIGIVEVANDSEVE